MTADVESVLSVEDMRQKARRVLPRVVFDYLEGGAEDELGTRCNVDAYQQHAFAPRYLRDVAEIDTSTTLLGRSYAQPFGIAPTGFAGLLRPGADLMLASAASQCGVPFILSGVSNASLEQVRRHDAGIWFQLYPTRDRSVAWDLVRRAEQAGVDHLVCTVDIPVSSKRERDVRNGFGLSWRAVSRGTIESALHPGWLVRFLRSGGVPAFESWRRYANPDASVLQVAQYLRTQSPAQFCWGDIDELRRLWKGKLILKGIMRGDDALRAIGCGVDGIIVSNHGGRQLDRAASSLAALRAVRAGVGRSYPLMLDGGVRRGSDLAVALCLGADFVFMGRPALYGVAVGAQAGAAKIMAILSDELNRVMKQLGARHVRELDASLLMNSLRSDSQASLP